MGMRKQMQAIGVLESMGSSGVLGRGHQNEL